MSQWHREPPQDEYDDSQPTTPIHMERASEIGCGWNVLLWIAFFFMVAAAIVFVLTISGGIH